MLWPVYRLVVVSWSWSLSICRREFTLIGQGCLHKQKNLALTHIYVLLKLIKKHTSRFYGKNVLFLLRKKLRCTYYPFLSVQQNWFPRLCFKNNAFRRQLHLALGGAADMKSYFLQRVKPLQSAIRKALIFHGNLVTACGNVQWPLAMQHTNIQLIYSIGGRRIAKELTSSLIGCRLLAI